MAVAARTTARFDLGRVFGTGFAVVRRRPVTLLAIGGLLTFPAAVASTWVSLNLLGPTPAATEFGPYWAHLGLIELVALLAAGIGWIRQGAVAFVVASEAGERRLDYGALVSRLLARLPVLYVLGLVDTLATLIGMVLLVVPGVIISMAWSVGPAVAMVEDKGLRSVLGRSAQLTRGYRFQLFGMFLVLGVAAGAIMFLVRGVCGASVLPGLGARDPQWLTYGIVPALGAVTGPVIGAITAAAYLELRTSKEGLATDHLADVFE